MGTHPFVPDDPYTVVEATVLGDAVEGLTVAFARSIAGQPADYAHNAVTDANGSLSLTISSADGVSGYYTARASNAAGETVGQWHSIPLNRNQRQVLKLTLGGGMKIVRVEPLTASKPVLAAATVPEVSGLAPNFPNPFNSATLITYHLSSPGPVQLVIYNVLGQPVRTLVNQSPGRRLLPDTVGCPRSAGRLAIDGDLYRTPELSPAECRHNACSTSSSAPNAQSKSPLII